MRRASWDAAGVCRECRKLRQQEASIQGGGGGGGEGGRRMRMLMRQSCLPGPLSTCADSIRSIRSLNAFCLVSEGVLFVVGVAFGAPKPPASLGGGRDEMRDRAAADRAFLL